MSFVISKIKKRVFLFRRKNLEKKIFSDERLEDYQKWDLLKLLDVLQNQFKNPRKLDCLDIGASAIEVIKLSGFVKKVVGINIATSYLRSDKLPSNVDLVVMDGTNLEFPANSFDFVYSINLLEHIHGVSECIDEQLRVVKPEGFCFVTWYPLWSSAKGHHIQEDMVSEWEKELAISAQGYRNDGTFIGDWDHLIISQEEMSDKLRSKLKSEKMVSHIVEFIYHSRELNRIFFDQVMEILKAKELQIIRLTKEEEIPSGELQEKLESLYPYSDFSTKGCQILFKKTANFPNSG